jgi:hypothetical protein
MIYGFLANGVLALHLAFVLFVLLGGLLVLRWSWIVWLHIPAILWGALVELAGWTCPLTPLEQWLLWRAGETGYQGGFIEHYLLGWLYPEGLTREAQLLMGIAVLVLNAAAYALVWRRRRRP